ncbi:MAG: protein kinase domain-containing protein [Mycobacterium sp.]
MTSDPSAPWTVGAVIDDLYEVREVITSGGMGVVHRVLHRGWNMDLAVKTAKPELVSSPARMADFEAEAETWVGLGLHPHVVTCVYVRRIDGLPRVFAEWIDGGSLADAIADGRLYEGTGDEAVARILDVAIQFAWGLDYAHSRQLVHQDVKPPNVMCTADWTVKVTDFGLAKARAAAGEAVPSGPGVSVLAGYGGMTPAYCSPEQAHAAHVVKSGGRPTPLSRATDVWSWAVSVWEMFTGEPPCQSGQAAAEAFRAFRENPWADDPAIPPMPDALAELLTRCLDPDPVARPRRFDQLADELAQLYQRLVGAPHPRTKPEAAQLLADALNNQALSLLDLGRIAEAEQLWQQALTADPHHLHTIYNRGLRRWRWGQTTDTALIAELETMRAAAPGAHVDHLLALVHLERFDTTAARRLLTAVAQETPDDRVVADAFIAARRQQELAAPRELSGARAVFRVVTMSADGRIVLTAGGSGDEAVQVWHVGSGACLRTLNASSVSSVALSGDGRVAVSAGGDTLQVFDVASGECLRTLSASSVSSVALSADGRIAVSGGDDTVRIWDMASGACLHTLTGRADSVDSVALSADGRIAISGGGAVRVWDVRSGTCLHTLAGHTYMAGSVALSADGRIAVSGSYDKTVRVWDLTNGTCQHTMAGHSDGVFSVAVSADGRIAVSGSYDKTVRVWDLTNGTCLRTMVGHTAGVRSVTVSADGRTAVSGGADTARVWEVPPARGQYAEWSYARPHSAHDLLAGAAAVDVAVHGAEALLAAGYGAAAAAQLRVARAVPGYRRDRRLVGLWRQLAGLGSRVRLQDAWPQHILNGYAKSVVAVSADGRIALSGGEDGTLRVWDVDSGACVQTLAGAPPLALSGDGRIAVFAGSDKTLLAWDLVEGACRHTLTGHTTSLNSVAVSADGRIAVSGSYGKTVRVWDLDGGVCVDLLEGHTGRVRSVAVSADGRIAVSGSSDRTLRVWDLRAATRLHTMAFHTNWVGSVAMSADGRIAVSATNGHERARVWDIQRGVCVRTLDGDSDSVTVAVSADGRIAVTGGDAADKMLRVWDLATKDCLHALTGHTGGIWSVALSADATVAVTGGDDQTVRVWALDWEYEFDADHAASGEASDWMRPGWKPPTPK